MKKIILLALCAAMLLPALASCGIINKVENAVTYPESYSITYEIRTAEGLIHTITKTVDEDGNVYLKSIDDEKLFINVDGSYSLYKKNADGGFSLVDGAKYTAEAVENELSSFSFYAKQATDKFIPTARRTDEVTVAGRAADTYRLGVNLLAVSFRHIYYIDKETGVCLGVDIRNTVFGKSIEANEEVFVCTEYITDNIDSLTNKI